jgi:ectoine hydroxylase-related dioxygenase (phytanoyl-CoA dioxygenase family)
VDGDRFGLIDFDRFHREELPSLLKEQEKVFSDADVEVVRPLAVELDDGRAYTYVPCGDTFTVEQGVERAHTAVRLDLEDWCAFAWELRSSFALLYAEELEVTRGSFGQVARWEPPLRVAFDGQDLYDLDDPPPVLDAAGNPLDCTRAFTLDDPEAEIADFLERAGFVHLRGVMDDAEVAALNAEVARALERARPDDRRSWWTTVDGRDVCNRINYLNDESEFVAGLGTDDRFLAIAALGGADLRDAPDRLDGNGVVIKVPGATEGLVDLPWHRDCGMGGHPVKCPMLNVGIQLDPATTATGQLEMIPGSHRGTSRLPGHRDAAGLPVVAIATEPGDVTVHFGHTLHAAPPPTDPEASGRKALYLSFVPPLLFEMVGPGQGYNDVLFTRHSGHVQHVDRLR